MGRIRIGSDDHKRRVCRAFVDTFRAYEPHEVRWPDLDPPALERLRGMPFRGEAVGSERTAAARVRAMADVEADPLLREAMQEEARHILFFTNWGACRARRLPLGRRPWFLAVRGLAVALQAFGRVRTALRLRAGAGREPDNFTMQVPDELAGGAEVTLRALARTCLAENERRLAPYDPDLLRPRLVPSLVGIALRVAPGRE